MGAPTFIGRTLKPVHLPPGARVVSPEEVRERIAAAEARAGGRAALARRIGITPAAITHARQGKRVSPTVMRAIGLDVTVRRVPVYWVVERKPRRK